MKRRLPAFAIAVLAVLSSANSLANGFTYDDRHIILANDLIRPLARVWTLFVLPYWPPASGGDGYRPLTLTLFAIQWAIGHGSPLFFHAVEIVLYVAVCLAAYRLTRLALPLTGAWIAAGLFAVHPVHVEAVANLVGQAELAAALAMIWAVIIYVEGRRQGRLSSMRCVAIAVLYLSGCLFKEHAIVLPGLLVCAELLLIEPTTSLRDRLRTQRALYLALGAIGLFYVYFRSAVIGRTIGFSTYPPFLTLHVSAADRILTMIGLVPTWVRLLWWPARLSAEYGPPAYPIATGLALMQLPGLLMLIGIIGIAVSCRKKNPALSFGVAWLVLTLLPSSNFLLPTGILLAERTLFSPSLGAMIAIASVVPLVIPELRTGAMRIAFLVANGVLLGAGIEKSTIQSAAWRDNESLFVASAAAEPQVYRSYYMLGAMLMEQGQRQNGERAYLRAISLFDRDPFVFYNLGQEYFRAGMFDRALLMYTKTFNIMPDFQDVRARMAVALAALGRYPEARTRAKEALLAGAGDPAMLHAIVQAANIDAVSRERLRQNARSSSAVVVAR